MNSIQRAVFASAVMDAMETQVGKIKSARRKRLYDRLVDGIEDDSLIFTQCKLSAAEIDIIIAEAGRRQIRKLTLRGIGMTHIPDSLCEMSELAELNLSFNSITALPHDIGRLRNLSKICLDCNPGLAELPEALLGMPSLTSLDLDATSCLPNLPDWFSGLRLERLSLSAVRLGEPAPIDRILGIITLRRLKLEGSRLQCLPDSVSLLSDLRWLYIGYNQLQDLPASLAECSRLARLSIVSNRFERFPDVVFKMKALTRLTVLNDLTFGTALADLRRLRPNLEIH